MATWFVAVAAIDMVRGRVHAHPTSGEATYGRLWAAVFLVVVIYLAWYLAIAPIHTFACVESKSD